MSELLSLAAWVWSLAAGVIFDGAVSRLGADSFRTRERAAAELRSPWAYPVIVRAAYRHPDPEVRAAAGRVARPWAHRAEDVRCLWLLVDPVATDPVAFWQDHAARTRLAWLCDRYGIGFPSDRTEMRPENDPGAFDCWVSGRHPWQPARDALMRVRWCLERAAKPTPEAADPRGY